MNGEERVYLVPDYMNQFKVAMEQYFPDEEPGRTMRLNLIGEFVARDKRKIVLYVAQGNPATTGIVTRIIYVMPVPEAASRLFGDEEDTLPPEGPKFTTFDNFAPKTAEQFVAENIALVPGIAGNWLSEVRRIRAAREVEPAGPRKSTMKNILLYWKDMRSRVYDALYQANVRMPLTSSGRTRTKTSSGPPPRHVSSKAASNIRSLRSTSGTLRSNYTRSTRSRTESPHYPSPIIRDSDPKSRSRSRSTRKNTSRSENPM
jgi:hypothetical protein